MPSITVAIRKRGPAGILQRLPLNIPLHNDGEVDTVDKETGDFAPGCTGGPRRAMLRLHAEQCQGHARCSEFLPELLIQDGYGPVQLKGDGAIPSALLERARLAVACYPEMAIELLHE